MKIATVIVLIIAIITASVALVFAINSSDSPLSSNNGVGGSFTTAPNEKKMLTSIASASLETGLSPLAGTIEDGVYAARDFSEFYAVSGDGIRKINGLKTIQISAFISGEVCELLINYVEINGRVVGGGTYQKTLEQAGVYEVELKLRYTLTEMPSALQGREGEKLLLVGFEADDYYSEAFAIDLNGGYSRNMFPQDERELGGSTGYVMLTDELVKSSEEYLYFFSSRRYYDKQDNSTFNIDSDVDLFRIKDGEVQIVAEKAHHRYLSFIDDHQLCYVRSEFATLTYTMGNVPVTSYSEMGFEVVRLDLTTMTETVARQFEETFSSAFKRFGDYLVALSDDEYDVLYTYNMATDAERTYNNVGVKMLLMFDVSQDGRYIAVGGSTTTASELNQCIKIIDIVTGESVGIQGKGLFVAAEDLFGFIGPNHLINTTFVGNGEELTFTVTKVEQIFKTFYYESVRD